jgi:beta-N-acetylhexosaminidase
LLLALEAGADILLMPRSVEEAITTVVGAVQSGRIKEARIDSSARRVLAAKVRAGLRTGRLVDLGAVDEHVNVPANSAVAREIAERSITLARDTRSLVPLAASAKRLLSITYADQDELVAGRTFNADLRTTLPDLRTAFVDGRTSDAEFSALELLSDSVDAIIVSAYVSPRERRGSVGAEGGISAFVERLAASGKPLVAISFGSPYLLTFFPSVPAYMLAWGGAEVSQRAAARALLGRSGISGRLPVSLPPHALAGTGIQRPASGTGGR